MNVLNLKMFLKMFYRRVKTLGESDSDDDTSNWVKKSRKAQKEKDLAAKRVSV